MFAVFLILKCPLALIDFFDAAEGDRWSNNNSWKEDAHVCFWFGVDCDSDDMVVGLRLENNNLRNANHDGVDLIALLTSISSLKVRVVLPHNA